MGCARCDHRGLGFRPNSSLTVAQSAAELAVLAATADQSDAAARGFRLLDSDEARKVNPALRGSMEGALLCERDAVVEPTNVLGALRDELAAGGPGYAFFSGRDAVAAEKVSPACTARSTPPESLRSSRCEMVAAIGES